MSYYTFVPAGDSTIQAGQSIAFTVTAYDRYGNARPNSGSIYLSVLGSSSAVLTPGDTLAFAGGSSVNFSVRDTVAGEFRIKGTQVGNSVVSGESGLITVTTAVPAVLSALSSLSDSLIVGVRTTLQVKLKDSYGNAISGGNVKFKRISVGNGNFQSTGSDSVVVATGSNGVASTEYLLSTLTSYTADTIQASYAGVDTLTFVFNLLPDSISYYTIADTSGSYRYTAGDTIQIRVQAFDVYDNLVTTSSRPVTLSSSNSGVKYISPSTTALSAGTAQFTVLDTVKQANLVFQVSDGTGKTATSSPFIIDPAALDSLHLFSGPSQSGTSYSQKADTLTAGSLFTLYVAGYDRYGNYIADVDTALWSSSGTLTPVVNHTGASLNYIPTRSNTQGRIRVQVSNPAVQGDSTGILTVQPAAISQVKIVLDSLGTQELGDTTLTAADTLLLYAGGFDDQNNFVQLVAGDWLSQPGSLGKFRISGNEDSTATGQKSVRFIADQAGNGTIRLTYSGYSDLSGLITVQVGSPYQVVIRTAAGGAGSPAHNAINMTTDESLTLYAAHYDVRNNFVNDLPVNWDTLRVSGDGLVDGLPASNASQITFSPVQAGAGRILVSSTTPGILPDTTGVITVTNGTLDHIVIVDGAGSAVTTDTLAAGDSLKLFAAGYDADNNFLHYVNVSWSLVGDSIGSFAASTGDSTVFRASTVGTAYLQADSAAFSDATSNIRVIPGTAAQLSKITETDGQSGVAGQQLPLPLRVRVKDVYGNEVEGDTVRWLPLTGGSVSNPYSVTNASGIAEIYYTLSSSTGTDTIAATLPNVTTIPDTVFFTATSEPDTGNVMQYVDEANDTLRVGSILSLVGPFRVKILDRFNNPVPNVRVSFSILKRPNGAINDSLTIYSDTTNAQGEAETYLHLGSRLGDYQIGAFATANPARLVFTGRANVPGNPAMLTIVSGGDQSDTVGQTLSSPIQVKITDVYENPVSGEVIHFVPLNGGSAFPTTDTTDAQGLTSSNWTLGTTSGTQQFRAYFESDPALSDTTTATALPDVPAHLQIVHIRNIAGDSISVPAHSGVPFAVRVSDQYGNVVPNQTVNFQIVSGSTAILSQSSVVTSTSGIATNNVQLDPDQDETIVRASVSGNGSLDLHLFRLSYQANSLQPYEAALGDTIAFQLDVVNPGPRAISLDTTGGVSYLYFSDGNREYQAPLLTTTINGGGTTTLQFAPTVLDTNFVASTYQLRINLEGRNADSILSGYFLTTPGAFSITNVTVQSVVGAVSELKRGEVLNVTMNLNNLGDVRVAVDSIATTPLLFRADGTPVAANFVRLGGPDTLSQGQYSLNFQLQNTAVLDTGQYYLDGRFVGTIVTSGSVVQDSSASVQGSFHVIANAVIQYANYLSPQQVTAQDSFEFAISLENSGQTNVTLDTARTFLTFGVDTFYLRSTQTISKNSSEILYFRKKAISSATSTTPYAVIVELHGEENGSDFGTVVNDISDSVQVLDRPQNLTLSNFDVQAGSVVQGQSGVQLSFDLENPGTNTAPINIDATDLVLHGSGNLQYSVVTPAFPVEISGGGSAHFVYSLTFPEGYPTGRDSIYATVSYQDEISGVTYSKNFYNNADTVKVLRRAVLVADTLMAIPDTVSQGQSGVTLKLVIRNTGVSPAVVDSAVLSFINNHTITSSPALPLIVNGGSRDTLIYTITVDSLAALGSEPLKAHLVYHDQQSNQTYQVSRQQLGYFFIQSFNPSLVLVNSVTITPIYLNRGHQQSVIARVQVLNQGQASITVLADSSYLIFSPDELSDSLISASQVIPGNSSDTLEFAIQVPEGATIGPVVVDASILYREQNSGQTYRKTGALVTDTVIVQEPARNTLSAIAITEGSTTVDSVSAGKTNLQISFTLTNSGQASNKITEITPIASSGIHFTRLSPVILPTLTGGAILNVLYSADVDSNLSGDYSINFQVTGQDQNDLRTVGPDTSTSPALLRVRQPGELTVDSLVVDAQVVYQGQQNIPATLYLRNSGVMPVALTETQLTFNDSQDGFVYTLQQSLPDTIYRGDSRALNFLITVSNSAPLGAVQVGALARATEIDLQQIQTRYLSDSLETTIQVQSQPQLRVYSVTSEYDSVSIGQDSVSARVRLHNEGGVTVYVDTLNLRFSSGVFQNIQQVFQPALRLTSGEEYTVTFDAIHVDENNQPGLVSLNVQLVGRDSVAGSTIVVNNADTTHSWQVVTPAVLSPVQMEPAHITMGQTAGLKLVLSNSGQAYNYLLQDSTLVNIGGVLYIPLPDTALVRGNTQDTLTFPDTVLNLNPGQFAVNLELRRYLENRAVLTDTLNFGNLQVDSLIHLDTLSVHYPAVVSQNTQFSFAISLRNAPSSATAILDSVTISELNLAKTFSATQLTGGDTLRDTLEYDVGNHAPGAQPLTLRYYWHDANSGINDTSEFALQPLQIQEQASLTILDILGPDDTEPDTVYTGQTNRLIRVRVRNAGGTTAIVKRVSLSYQFGVYQISRTDSIEQIPADQTVEFQFLVNIASNSATGLDSFGAEVAYQDSLNGIARSATASGLYSWVIMRPDQPEILSLSSSRNEVLIGETGVPITVRIRNNSQRQLFIDTLEVYSHKVNQPTYLPAVLTGLVVEPAQTQNVILELTVLDSAVTGRDTVDARMVAHAIFPPDTVWYELPKSNSPWHWVIQQRPNIQPISLNLSQDTLSTGQNFVPLEVVVKNLAQGVPTASGVIDSLQVLVNDTLNYPGIQWIEPSSWGDTLSQDVQHTYQFQFRPDSTVASGVYSLKVRAFYHDLFTSEKDTVLSGELAQFTVQKAAYLSISVPQTNRQVTHWGNLYDTLSVNLKNTGEARARLTLDTVLTRNGTVEINLIPHGFSTPFMLGGGAAKVLKYLIRYPQTYDFNDTLQFALGIKYSDLNSLFVYQDTSSWSSDFTILTPPRISYVDNSLTPSTLTDSSHANIVFKLQVVNTGSSQVVLNPDSTRFTIPSVAGSRTTLNPDSGVVIYPDSVTQLVFKPLNVNLPDGQYSTEFFLYGMVHGEVFEKNYASDPLTVGGSINIQRLYFSGSVVGDTLSVLQGATGVELVMDVSSTITEDLTIDSVGTYLNLVNFQNGTVISPSDLHLVRVDTISTIPAQGFVTLKFQFDLPANIIPIGKYYVNGHIKATGSGIFTDEMIKGAWLRVLSAAHIAYLRSSLQPPRALAGQRIQFQVSVVDTGVSGITILGDSSYLAIHTADTTLTAYPVGNYFLPGAAQDTVRINFKSIGIPAGFAATQYPIHLHLKGVLETGDRDSAHIVLSDLFTVLDTAYVRAQSLALVPQAVPGQTNMPLSLDVENLGESVGELTDVSFIFRLGDTLDVSSLWSVSGLDTLLPHQLAPGQVYSLQGQLNLSGQAPVGRVFARAITTYRDTLMPQVILRDTSAVLDSIDVLRPASVQVVATEVDSSSLVHPLFVNYGQSFRIRTRVRNNGQDAITNMRISLLYNGTVQDSVTGLSLSAGSAQEVLLNAVAPSVSGNALYQVRIDRAFSQLTGDSVSILPSIDDNARVTVQRPAELVLSLSSVDTVAQQQQFSLQAQVANLGEAGYDSTGKLRIELPAGFTLSGGDSVQSFTSDSSTVQWEITAPTAAIPEGAYLKVSYAALPGDSNTAQPVLLHNNQHSDSLLVHVIDQGTVEISAFYFPNSPLPDSTMMLASTLQDSIELVVQVAISSFLSLHRQATLILPPQISGVDTLTKPIPASNQVRWFLKAPDTPTADSLVIQVRVQATSSLDGSVVEESASTYLKTLPRPLLQLQAQITDPPGARDSTVSYGQRFTFQATVSNSGHNLLLGTGQLKLVPGDLLQLESVAVQPFTIGQPVSWTVRVDSNAQVVAIMRKIQDLKQKKYQQLNSAAGGASLFAADVIDDQIQSLENQLSNLLTTSFLRVEFAQRPMDSLSHKPVEVINPELEMTIQIQARPEIKITSVNFPATVSTGQTFEVQALVDTSEQIASQRFARIQFLNNPGFHVADSIKTYAGEVVTWQVTAPSAGSISTYRDVAFRVVTWAQDENSGDQFADSTERTLRVEREAILGLSLHVVGQPDTIGGYRLSFNQNFRITARPINKGYAAATGTGKIRLELVESDGLEIVSGAEVMSFNYPDSVVWTLRTPDRLINTNIRVSYEEVPLDVNKQQPATLDTSSSVASLSIATEIRRLVVNKFDLEKTFGGGLDSIKRQGSKNYPVLGLTFFNEKFSQYASTIHVDSLSIAVLDQNGMPINNPQNLVSRIVLANPAYFHSLKKGNGEPKVFAELPITSGMSNPIPISFSNIMQIDPGSTDSLVVYVDIASNAPNKSFSIQVGSITAYEHSRENPVQVVDPDGRLFSPDNPVGSSIHITVVAKEVEKIFGNYPNPFGSTVPTTKFVFWAEDAGTAELRIYTLMGGLVYSHSVSLPEGNKLYDGLITWDGKNNVGREVLNGVYLAILKVRYKNGQTRSFKTKVAYIK